MAMGKNDRADLEIFIHVCPDSVDTGARGFFRHQRIHYNPAGFAADKAHYGKVEAANLVDFTGNNRVQTRLIVQLLLPHQAGINFGRTGFGCVLIQKTVLPHIPDRSFPGGNRGFKGRNQITGGIVVIIYIVEIQFLQNALIGCRSK